MQGAGQGNVIDIVAGRVGDRAILTPAGHAAIDDPGITREDDVGAEAQPFHHAGPKPFDQNVGLGAQLECGGDGLGVLEVERDVATPA